MMKRVYKIMIVASVFSIMNAKIITYADTEKSFSNLKDVQQNIYESLKNRDGNISFIYTGDKTEFKENIEGIIKLAYSEDDYTERSWLLIQPKISVSSSEIDTNISVSYLTTKEEEDYVDGEIKNVVAQLIKPNMKDIEKIRAINDYLVKRYDYDGNLKSNSAYSALRTAKATCQGYSMTAYKMLTLAGINNRIIVGTINGGSHSWNYVNIGENWYHLDITNNDTNRTDKYFLVPNIVLEANNYVWDKKNYPQ